MTKIISFYLPQFHPIPENDKWWGKGFTEWTNVKSATPLFFGHNQPRIPHDLNYYSLLEADTLRWQAKLMNEYGVDGMCFYHYWFNGKQLLESPISILLNNDDIEMPFCLSWANEPWTRAWDGENKEILMPQEYGNEVEWQQHFEYLVKAFNDIRYLRHEGKPIFIIYRSASIPDVDLMLKFWDDLARSYGFPGIHFIKMNTSFKDSTLDEKFDASIDFEPMYTVGHQLKGYRRYIRSLSVRLKRAINKTSLFNILEDKISYDYIWSNILSRPLKENVYPGAFVDWDNTPRKSERGLVMIGGSPDKFAKYISAQYLRCKQANLPYMFINAWNEWAEGTYLEPDTTNGYSYLEAIKIAKES